jgi:hypothetical protein
MMENSVAFFDINSNNLTLWFNGKNDILDQQEEKKQNYAGGSKVGIEADYNGEVVRATDPLSSTNEVHFQMPQRTTFKVNSIFSIVISLGNP